MSSRYYDDVALFIGNLKTTKKGFALYVMPILEKKGKVVTADGVRGTYEVVVPLGNGGSRQVRLTFPKIPTVLVAADLLVPGRGKTYHLPIRSSELNHSQNIAAVIPLVAEELRVKKREVVAGGVRISKKVYRETKTVDEPLLREEIDIERVPVHRFVEAPEAIRQEGEAMIVPLYEEALVVEKRLLLREELVIRKRRTEIHTPKKVTRRREDVVIQDLDAQGNLKRGNK